MKKLIASLAALALTVSVLPCAAASAAEDTDAEHISKTVTIGDVNNSGKIDVGDLVKAGRFMLGEYVDDFSSLLFDVNMDGENDVFDLIGLRKLVLEPDSGLVQTYTMDMLKSIKELKCDDIKFDNFEDAKAYFMDMLSSNEEIKKFTDLYDEEFFKENDLILRPFIQENSDKIIYDFADDIYNHAEKILQLNLDDEDADTVKDQFGSVLAQVTVPKAMTDLITELDLTTLSSVSFPFDGTDIKLPMLDGKTELNVDDLTEYLNSLQIPDWLSEIFGDDELAGLPKGSLEDIYEELGISPIEGFDIKDIDISSFINRL